jgi:FtsP/CotA-like multicopper oxidase with cupredoxin domain
MAVNFFLILLCAQWLLQPALAGVAEAPYPSKRSQPKRFEVELTWQTGAPDGVPRKMIFTNGQFPGPQLNLVEGDKVEFVVKNSLPFETSIHFHGIEQLGSPWSDGVPGVSQRPIQPGATFIYRWTATQYGTYWYHGHDRGHLGDGLYGPIIIQPAPQTPSPFDKITKSPAELQKMREAERDPKPLIVADWSHYTFEEFFNIELAGGIDDFCVDSILINGKGSDICKSQDELNSLTSPPQQFILGGRTLTDKGLVFRALCQILFIRMLIREGVFRSTYL